MHHLFDIQNLYRSVYPTVYNSTSEGIQDGFYVVKIDTRSLRDRCIEDVIAIRGPYRPDIIYEFVSPKDYNNFLRRCMNIVDIN